MQTTKIVAITMPPAMAKEAARLAKKQNRTMSELMREAFRQYQQQEKVRPSAAALQELASALAALREDAKEKKLGQADDWGDRCRSLRLSAGSSRREETLWVSPPMIVIDTNVLVSAVIKEQGAEAAVLNIVATGRLDLHVSRPILEEYKGVLSRPKFASLDPPRVQRVPAILRCRDGPRAGCDAGCVLRLLMNPKSVPQVRRGCGSRLPDYR